MRDSHHNFSSLFSIFEHDKPDKTGTILKTIGAVSFTISFFAWIPYYYIQQDETVISETLGWMSSIGFIVGIFMFAATGLHYLGGKKGFMNFISSANPLLRYTFLLLFLPTIIITVLALIVLLITKLPSFLSA